MPFCIFTLTFSHIKKEKRGGVHHDEMAEKEAERAESYD
jgi:hypothetical protein